MNSRPVKQMWLPLQVEDELGTCDLSAENPQPWEGLMERVLAPDPDSPGDEMDIPRKKG